MRPWGARAYPSFDLVPRWPFAVHAQHDMKRRMGAWSWLEVGSPRPVASKAPLGTVVVMDPNFSRFRARPVARTAARTTARKARAVSSIALVVTFAIVAVLFYVEAQSNLVPSSPSGSPTTTTPISNAQNAAGDATAMSVASSATEVAQLRNQVPNAADVQTAASEASNGSSTVTVTIPMNTAPSNPQLTQLTITENGAGNAVVCLSMPTVPGGQATTTNCP